MRPNITDSAVKVGAVIVVAAWLTLISYGGARLLGWV
jgi:hypothetical protein